MNSQPLKVFQNISRLYKDGEIIWRYLWHSWNRTKLHGGFWWETL